MRLWCTRSMTLLTNDSHISNPQTYDTFLFFSLNQHCSVTNNFKFNDSMSMYLCWKGEIKLFFFYNQSKVSLLKRRNLWRVMYSNTSLSVHLFLPSQSPWFGYQNKTEQKMKMRPMNTCIAACKTLKLKSIFLNLGHLSFL